MIFALPTELALATLMAKDATLPMPLGSVTVKVMVQVPSVFGAVKIASTTDGVVSLPALTTLAPTLPQLAAQAKASSAVSPASGSWATALRFTVSP